MREISDKIEYSNQDKFWHNEDFETDTAKEYVNELEKRLGEIQKELFFLSSLCKQTKLDYLNWKLQLLIIKTKL
jgi:hypothetical protein